jgi:hypothetical protein
MKLLVSRMRTVNVLKSSSCRIVWIHGYGGVGKTSLVQTAFQDEDYYCRGKFERIRSAQPYSAIITLLSRLCLILEFGFPAIPVSAEVAGTIGEHPSADTSQIFSYDKDADQEETDVVYTEQSRNRQHTASTTTTTRRNWNGASKS